MKIETLEKAKDIQEEIRTLEKEISFLESNSKIERNFFPISRKPKEKTYKGFWCSRDIDLLTAV